MMANYFLIFVLFWLGSFPEHESIDPVSTMADSVKIALVINRQKVAKHNLSKLKITVRVENHGRDALDTELHRYELFVNDHPSKAFSLAVGNGKREEKWFALQPGDSAEMTWNSMGKSLFTKRGEYILQLKTPFGDADPVRIKITAL